MDILIAIIQHTTTKHMNRNNCFDTMSNDDSFAGESNMQFFCFVFFLSSNRSYAVRVQISSPRFWIWKLCENMDFVLKNDCFVSWIFKFIDPSSVANHQIEHRNIKQTKKHKTSSTIALRIEITSYIFLLARSTWIKKRKLSSILFQNFVFFI